MEQLIGTGVAKSMSVKVGDGLTILAVTADGALNGLSIGFRTVKGAIDFRTRVRRLVAVDLWEISIVTFPLLAGARVRAVKGAASSSQVCRPSLSHTRTRAARDWARGVGMSNGWWV